MLNVRKAVLSTSLVTGIMSFIYGMYSVLQLSASSGSFDRSELMVSMGFLLLSFGVYAFSSSKKGQISEDSMDHSFNSASSSRKSTPSEDQALEKYCKLTSQMNDLNESVVKSEKSLNVKINNLADIISSLNLSLSSELMQATSKLEDISGSNNKMLDDNLSEVLNEKLEEFSVNLIQKEDLGFISGEVNSISKQMEGLLSFDSEFVGQVDNISQKLTNIAGPSQNIIDSLEVIYKKLEHLSSDTEKDNEISENVEFVIEKLSGLTKFTHQLTKVTMDLKEREIQNGNKLERLLKESSNFSRTEVEFTEEVVSNKVEAKVIRSQEPIEEEYENDLEACVLEAVSGLSNICFAKGISLDVDVEAGIELKHSLNNVKNMITSLVMESISRNSKIEGSKRITVLSSIKNERVNLEFTNMLLDETEDVLSIIGANERVFNYSSDKSGSKFEPYYFSSLVNKCGDTIGNRYNLSIAFDSDEFISSVPTRMATI